MRIPASTYRLQLTPDFGFRDAKDLVPYLDALGVSDLYLSPILAAKEGSTHGYDITDPTRLNPALGTRADFDALVEATCDHKMGVILDIVPNHMAATAENPWWRDVLACGEESDYAEFFDIDWHPPWPVARDQLLLPVLGAHYNDVLEGGELSVERTDDGVVVRYYDNEFPISRKSCSDLSDAEIARLNDDPNALDALLAVQSYQLRYWKTQRYELNYRRFFNISDLAGVRVEEPRVRRAMHDLIGTLWEERKLSGLRVDHIDGLRDPKAYLQWLQQTFRGPKDTEPYVLVEKILAPHENVPSDWPVAGTTGYEYLNKLNGVFVDPDGHRRLDAVYAEFTGRTDPFRTVVYQKKRYVARWLFEAELDLMAHSLAKLAAKMRQGRDLTMHQLGEALVEISACLTVYRTYITDSSVTDRDREYIKQAVDHAHNVRPDLDQAYYTFVEHLLLVDVPESLVDETLEFVKSWQQFTPPLMAKGLEDTSLYVYHHLISLNTVGGEPDEGDVSLGEFHQFSQRRAESWPGTMNSTSTHDSKRGEDVRSRIDVLSEMPGAFADRLTDWARWNAPKKMHPEVAEPPSRNEEMLLYQTLIGSWPLDRDGLAAYPDRLREYLIKSAREAKEKTNWHNSDERHEYALARFAQRILEDTPENAFLADFIEFQEKIAFFGAMNSLSQVVLKVASPGVPDFYQGSEHWNLTLVDPDNRRPVDYQARRDALDEMRAVDDDQLGAHARSLLMDWKDARIKQFVTWRALRCRRRHHDLFTHGGYQPLYGLQKARPYLCAFSRSHQNRHLVAVAPRRVSRLVDPFEFPTGGVWERALLRLSKELPERWTNVLTGEQVDTVDGSERCLSLEALFDSLPVALLVSDTC
jgi:(1->4)-alpha-D-glucan 1-alpha-D-glucosylmutase